MKNQVFKIFAAVILIITINACSSSDNPAEPAQSASVINGNWGSGLWSYTGGSATDSLVVKLTLQEKDGVVTGTGIVGTLFQDNSNSISVTMNGNVTGTYSGQSINLLLTSTVTGDKYVYSGNWATVNTNFMGTVSVTVLGKSHIFSDISLGNKF